MSAERVLVTGASGYIATHVVKQLLESGYKVRGTVQSLADPGKYAALYGIHPSGKENLELIEAQLLEESCWAEAVKGVTYICHVASPLPMVTPENEDDLIKPALEGTLSVLKAASLEKSVKRVVITSSLAAITEPVGNDHIKDESNWANPADAPASAAYNKSKIIAERAAWAFHESLPSDSRFELCTINPSLVFGPLLYPRYGASVRNVKLFLENALAYILPFSYPCVDVRDVAQAHVTCLTLPEASGHRHILFNRNAWSKEIHGILRKEFEPQGYTIAKEETSKEFFDKMLEDYPDLNRGKFYWSKEMKVDNTRMRKVLGINPISVEKSVIDSAYSFIEFGLTEKKPGYKGLRQE